MEFTEDILRIPKAVAAQFARVNSFFYDELVSEGNLALVLASSRYRVTEGISYKTYLFHYVRMSMQRFICERQGKGRSKNAKWGRYESLSLHDEMNFSCVEEEDFPMERLHLAFSVLNKLPPVDRRIFLLRYQEEKTVQEIGREVGLHFGTVSRRLQATHKWINGYLTEKECS